MAFDYSEIADDAVGILTEFGQSITLTKPGTDSAYDPQTGQVTGTLAVFLGVGAVFDYTQRDMANTEIKQGDRRIYIAPNLGAMPATGDNVTLADGTILSIVASRPLNPAGTILLHDAQLRGV